MFVKLRFLVPGDAYCSNVNPDWSSDCPDRLRSLTGTASIEMVLVPLEGVPFQVDQQAVAVKLQFRKALITIWSYAIRSFERPEEGFVLYFTSEQVVA